MTASGYVYTVNHLGKTYYYKPSEDKWVQDIKKISIGDIYFDSLLVRATLGYPDKPSKNDLPFENPFEKKKFKIEIE